MWFHMILIGNNNYFPKLTGLCDGESVKEKLNSYIVFWLILVFNPLNAELNPICHLLALLGGATIVDVSRLRVNRGILFLGARGE
jgi:hypothetical protein